MSSLGNILADTQRVLFFTGAGISTESGIPDFRSPGGLWSRYDPAQLTFDRYIASSRVRTESWQMRREFFAAGARPNAGHLAIAAFERSGRSVGVITQNIDGLHHEAGSTSVVEIHGTARTVACIGISPRDGRPAGCGWSAPTSWAFERIDAGDADPSCPVCEGLVKSATISFGQQMDPAVLGRAGELLAVADAVVAVGSSLVVYPAAGLLEAAVLRGLPCAIVNAEPTPLDELATVVVRGTAGAVLSDAVHQVLDVDVLDVNKLPHIDNDLP